ncbi:IPT/TIG domain-containing protein [Spirosoma aerophilum]
MKSTFIFFFLFVIGITVSSCRVQHSPPELIRLSTDQAYVGQTITLSGYQFGTDPTVIFGPSTPASIVSNDETTIQAKVPPVAPGITQIRVQNNEGSSDPLAFLVRQPAPIITAFTPANGLPGTVVEITGNYLNQIKRIRFDNVDAIVKDSTLQKLTIVVPPNLPRGPLPLSIETIGGQEILKFIVAGTPQITSISPLNTKRGAEFVISGKNLTDGVVSINGLTTEKALTTVKDTEIRTVVPESATSGLVTVRVFETLVATSTDSLKIIPAPFITHLLAQDGYAGEKLIVEGVNLADASSFTIDNVPATFRVLNSRQVEVIIPTLPASKPVAVAASGIGGSTVASESLFYFLPPSNLVLNPARQLQGRPLTVSGKDLYRITGATISGIPVNINDRTEGFNVLTAVPTNASSGLVVLSNRAGAATASLVVIQNAVVSSVLPLKARVGDRVVLRGDFLMNADILFSGSTTKAADGGKNTDTERWVLVPADAQTGPIRVTNETNSTATTTPFTVLRLISAIDFSPKSGKVGDEIILTGQTITTVQEVRFSNGNSTAAKFVVEGNTIRVTVPAGAITGQICLTNEAGTSCSSSNFTVIR